MTDNKDDYYSVLGIARDASKDDIRKAYKKLARKFHPDANKDNPDAIDQFKKVGEAWGVLGNEEKRANYDKYGTAKAPQFAGGDPGSGQQPWSWSSSDGGDVPFDLEDLFGGFRGQGGYGGQQTSGRQWPVRGHDVRAEIEIPFLLAAEGGKHDLQFQRPGSTTSEMVTVTIPAGMETGNVIRLNGLGTPGSGGGPPGDLMVNIRVAKHPWFKRNGANIDLEVPISITEAALGTKADIPTLRDGTVVLTIPAGASSGTKLRLRGKGIRDPRTGEYGDQFAVVKIVAPKELDDETRDLLEQLDQKLETSVRGQWS